jgi:hypothetical protein
MELLDLALTVAAIVGSAYVLYRCWWKNRDTCPGYPPKPENRGKPLQPRYPERAGRSTLRGVEFPPRKRQEPPGKLGEGLPGAKDQADGS